MPRTYLRYEPDTVSGLIVTPPGALYSLSGDAIFSATHSTVTVLDAQTGDPIGVFDPSLDSAVSFLVRAPRHPYLAVGYQNGTVLVLECSDPLNPTLFSTFSAHTTSISCILFSENADLVITASADADVIFWDLVDRKALFRLAGGHSAPITGLTLLYDGAFLVTASRDKTAIVWDLQVRERVQTIADANYSIRGLTAIKFDTPGPSDTKDVVMSSLPAHATDYFLFIGGDAHTLGIWTTAKPHLCCSVEEFLLTTASDSELLANYRVLLKLQGAEDPSGMIPLSAKDQRNALVRTTVRHISEEGLVQSTEPLLSSAAHAFYSIGHLSRTIAEPIILLAHDPATACLVVVSTRTIEYFSVLSPAEAAKRARRRVLRHIKAAVDRMCERRRKIDEHLKDVAAAELGASSRTEEERRAAVAECSAFLQKPLELLLPSDILHSRLIVKSPYGAKLLSASLHRGSLLLATSENLLQTFSVAVSGTKTLTCTDACEIASMGHRTVIHAVALNDTDTLLATVSSGELKLWNVRTSKSIASVVLPEPIKTPTAVHVLSGNRYAVVADVSGCLASVDLAVGEVISLFRAHSKKVTSLHVHRGQIITASEDGFVKFWSLDLTGRDTEGEDTAAGSASNAELRFVQEQAFDIGQAISALAFDPAWKLVFVALLDNTIRVHFVDTFRFKIVLYGHALPVTGMSVSYTGEKLVTCSHDKTIRVWGLQFGECQKILRYEAGFSSIALVRDTHLALAAAKDGTVSYWDLDSFTLLSVLGEGDHGLRYSRGHFGEITGMALARNGRFLVTVGFDRAVRQWLQTEDLLSADDEEKKRLERAMDSAYTTKQWDAPAANTDAVVNQNSKEGQYAADILLEAIELVSFELQKQADGGDSADARLLGKTPYEYLLHVLTREIKHETIDDAIAALTTVAALKLLDYLTVLLERRTHPVEFLIRITLTLITVYFRRSSNTSGLKDKVVAAKKHIMSCLDIIEDEIGCNLGSLRIMSTLVDAGHY